MSETGPQVRTTTGLVRGRSENGLSVFRGIPFARPPVGELRFAAPQPADPWDGVRDAFSFGPPPPQSLVFGPPSNPATGDDWLTVNVWSPQLNAALPVMVWIYGGAYAIGQSGDPSYDGTRLAAEGDVVVVTFNHRLGVDGFGQLEGAPANRGLLDQVAALEWVRANIAAFGGDPDRVTVFGESAGAGSVASLLAMPRAAGLFRRAITQSAPGTSFSPPLAADILTEIAALLDVAPTVDDLRRIPTADLVAASDMFATAMQPEISRWGAAAYTGIPFAPVVDGDVLPRTPFDALADGAAREVELIAGHTRDEYRLLLAADGRLGNLTENDAATALEILAPAGYREAYPDATAERIYELVHSDWLFRMPSHRLAEAQIVGGGRAYVYELAWPDTGLGACHGLDVPLVFGTTPLLGFLLDPEQLPAAEQVSQLFRTAWTAFAHTGDPGWPQYDATHRQVALFTTELTITPYPEEVSRRLWAGHSFAPL
ncbi:carboxylesterase/lipase family protein [Kribbella jiaozuonensis]|uniref:Carboxylic ester hydrolase n=1 Tax=Kribbella jiaozuonensis TaxID=2575441 RepID=A0A4U3M5Z6_9ACTN|nr:carboxylesterase family protein [Kribbella jiaozuonensis]TKK79273.1 carboxylesterase family protein [Kribbella jiaozuonensis]TKK83344.1 carboxylesterase family protein [Kribbella jiaozuonensis]